MTAGTTRTDPLIVWGAVLATVLFVLYVYPGPLAPVRSHFAGSCTELPMEASAEDIRIDRQRGVAYLSYLDRAKPRSTSVSGTVMLVDLNAAEPRIRAALSTTPPGFRPSGMSLHVPAEGPRRLFVINTVHGGVDSVEIFEQTPTGTFAHVESVRDRLLASANALVAVGPRQFYAASFSGQNPASEPDRRDLRRGSWNVVYYDGKRMRAVAERLRMASGIEISPDGREIYVSEANRRQLRIFDRSMQRGDLKLRDTVPLGSVPDNLTVGDDGSVWIAAHPRAMTLARHFEDATTRSPTQVLKFTPGAIGDERVSEVYLNDGTQLSAGSVAATWRDRMLVGALNDRRLLVCRLTPDGPER